MKDTAGAGIRRALGLGLLAAALLIVILRDAVAVLEASAAADITGPLLPGQSQSIGNLVFLGLGTPARAAMAITPLCSTVVLIVPVLLIGAAMFTWLRQALVHRIAAGVAVAAVLVIAANIGRYVLLGILLVSFGRDAFQIGHHWIGAIGVLALFGLALLLMVRIATGGVDRPSARFSSTADIAAAHRTRQENHA